MLMLTIAQTILSIVKTGPLRGEYGTASVIRNENGRLVRRRADDVGLRQPRGMTPAISCERRRAIRHALALIARAYRSLRGEGSAAQGAPQLRPLGERPGVLSSLLLILGSATRSPEQNRHRGWRVRGIDVSGDRRWCWLLFAVSCLYIVLLLRFYLVRYDVPDYFLYHHFGLQGLPAKDGFSSLFMLLAKYDTRYPLAYHIVPLLCLGVALFSLNVAFRTLPWVERALLLGFSFSSGIWYYFAGKVFYEFPFIALCLSLSVLAVAMGERRTSGRGWRALALWLMGFGLSFKPFALFAALGLLLLIAASRRMRSLYSARRASEWLNSIACFAAGYLCGNYNLLFCFHDTMQGLRGYPAQSSLRAHLFDDAKLVWDHINLASFHTGALHVVGAGVILFALPLLLKNRRYLLVNLVIAAGYAVFIEKFSPGYTWHAFSFCLFVIFTLAYMLTESADLHGARLLAFRALVSLVLALQVYSNFIAYLPRQIAWFDATRSAGEALERESGRINHEILTLADQLDGTFTVNLTYKFTKPVADETYGQNPLWVGDPQGWRSVLTHPRYSAAAGHEYVIFVEPTALLQIPSYIPERRDVRTAEALGYRIGYYATP